MAIKYGWISVTAQKTAKVKGVWYGTPCGKCIQVNLLSDSIIDSGTKWPDVTFLGKVEDSVFYGFNKPPNVSEYVNWKAQFAAFTKALNKQHTFANSVVVNEFYNELYNE